MRRGKGADSTHSEDAGVHRCTLCTHLTPPPPLSLSLCPCLYNFNICVAKQGTLGMRPGNGIKSISDSWKLSTTIQKLPESWHSLATKQTKVITRLVTVSLFSCAHMHCTRIWCTHGDYVYTSTRFFDLMCTHCARTWCTDGNSVVFILAQWGCPHQQRVCIKSTDNSTIEASSHTDSSHASAHYTNVPKLACGKP